MCLNLKDVNDGNFQSECLSVNKSSFDLMWGKYLLLFNDALFCFSVVFVWLKVIRHAQLLSVKRCNKAFISLELSHSCYLGINAVQLRGPAAL